MVRYLFYTIGDLTYQSPLVKQGHPHLDQTPDNLEGVRDGISQSLHRLARQ